MPLRVRGSALKHGYSIEDSLHAIHMAMAAIEIDPRNGPPKLLFLGPDHARNLLEVIGGQMADTLLIWRADTCRSDYLKLLPAQGNTTDLRHAGLHEAVTWCFAGLPGGFGWFCL